MKAEPAERFLKLIQSILLPFNKNWPDPDYLFLLIELKNRDNQIRRDTLLEQAYYHESQKTDRVSHLLEAQRLRFLAAEVLKDPELAKDIEKFEGFDSYQKDEDRETTSTDHYENVSVPAEVPFPAEVSFKVFMEEALNNFNEFVIGVKEVVFGKFEPYEDIKSVSWTKFNPCVCCSGSGILAGPNEYETISCDACNGTGDDSVRQAEIEFLDQMEYQRLEQKYRGEDK